MMNNMRQPIIDKCIGCGKIVDEKFCSVYLVPASKWRMGNCPMATHLEKQKTELKKIDPLKASKQSMKKR